ncbi:hypothetical protein IU449_02510 [Nocardia higoensis]|uniref:Uncharacterized protein n=1 Tax=Nocardia higoensis TaxID=228599 RepID=A0ABS0D9K1_9NOCA|nr:hypothetical protein [Nocardia higoensis]MBF6353428.1 hypothetical protein [Nocardia higoensis]
MSARQVMVAAGCLIALQLAIRAAVAFSGDFYWDDLILIGRSGQLPLLSGEFLLYDHDGHFMPAAFALAWLSTALAPLDWTVPAVTSIAGQALASLAVLRVVRLVVGTRPVLLPPLAFYLFSPLTLPSFAWWAAGLNSLPLQIGLAWVAGDAIALCRTGRLRFAVSGAMVAVVSLAFFEKSVLVPLVAFVTVALMYRVDGVPRAVRTTLVRGRALWIPLAVVVASWAAVYLRFTDPRPAGPTAAEAAELVHHATSLGLVPTLLGGPWTWERWPPSPPWATPPVGLVVLGWLAVTVAVAWSLRYRQRTAAVWAMLLVYIALSETSMILVRTGPDTADELAQTLRYVADSAVLIALGWALIARAPRRTAVRPSYALSRTRSHSVVVVVVVAVTAFVVSSLCSTVTFAQRWRDNPTVGYLANARAGLAADQSTPILDHPVAIHILLPVAHPHNRVSSVFGPLRERPEFRRSTEVLRVLDDSGRLVPATVTWTRALGKGPVPGCGHRVAGGSAELPLGGPLMDWEWAVHLNYYANTDGDIELGLDGSEDTVRVPVRAGLHQVFVRLLGAGRALRVRTVTPGLTLCVGNGPVGVVVPTPGAGS